MCASKKTLKWEHFPHGADIGIRGFGDTISAAFEQTAMAMTAVVSDLSTIANNEVVEITCKESDYELLLIDWLNALIYEMATRRMLFCKFEISVSDGVLRAKAWGENINIKKHKPVVEVKGATYTSLIVSHTKDGTWMAQCVIDV